MTTLAALLQARAERCTPTYLSVHQQIQAEGRYDRGMIMRCALLSARAEWKRCKQQWMIHTTWQSVMSEALRRTWHVARSAMEARAWTPQQTNTDYRIAAE